MKLPASVKKRGRLRREMRGKEVERSRTGRGRECCRGDTRCTTGEIFINPTRSVLIRPSATTRSDCLLLPVLICHLLSLCSGASSHHNCEKHFNANSERGQSQTVYKNTMGSGSKCFYSLTNDGAEGRKEQPCLIRRGLIWDASGQPVPVRKTLHPAQCGNTFPSHLKENA